MTVLEDLYYGNLQPCDVKQSAEVRRKLSAMTAAEEKLTAAMPNDILSNKVVDAFNMQTELIALCERDAFIDGFRLGVKLMLETLLSQ